MTESIHNWITKKKKKILIHLINCRMQILYNMECIYANISDYQKDQDHGNFSCDVIHPNWSVIIDGLELVHHGEVWTPGVIQRVVTLAIIMTFTFFGNIIIVVVLTFSKYRKLTSRVNIFIINLAGGDLAVLVFTMTTEVVFVAFEKRWMLGPVLCKLMVYMQIVTLASTTFILTAMSYDRYLALCRPMSFGHSSNRAPRMILFSWIMAFIFAIPQLLIFKQVAVGIYPDGDIKYRCASQGYTHWWQRQTYFTFMAAYILVVPTIIITFCYINVVRIVWQQGTTIAKGKKGEETLRRAIKNNKSIPRAKVRTIKMTLSIICSFIMCWTPYFVVHLIHIWTKYQYEIPEAVYVFAETIALLNSALNPILYGCFNIKLKRGLLEVFCPSRLQSTNAMKTEVTRYVSMSDFYGRTDPRKSGNKISVQRQRTNSGSPTQSSYRVENHDNSPSLNCRETSYTRLIPQRSCLVKQSHESHNHVTPSHVTSKSRSHNNHQGSHTTGSDILSPQEGEGSQFLSAHCCNGVN